MHNSRPDPSDCGSPGSIRAQTKVFRRKLGRRGEENCHVLLTGLAYFCRQLQETVFYDGREWSVSILDLAPNISRYRRLAVCARELLRADVWYKVGGELGRGRLNKLAQSLGVPVIVHWVGSDVLAALRYFTGNTRSLARTKALTHWVGAPWLADELRKLGIEASFVPLPLKSVGMILDKPPPPLPTNFAVGTYVPDRNPEFYGWSHIQRLAHDFPDIEIIVVGGTGRFASSCPPNVRFLGWVRDISSAFAGVTVVVRMTQHDGYGGTIQEALALGRYAVWSYPFSAPGSFVAIDYRTLCDHVRRLHTLHEQGLLHLNRGGRDYMRTNMHPAILAGRIAEGIRRAAAGQGD